MKPYSIILTIAGLLLYSNSYSDTHFDSLYNLAKNSEGIDLGEKALEEALRTNRSDQIAKAHYLLGYRKKQLNMYYDALQNYYKALNSFRIDGNITWQCHTLWNIGIIYKDAGFLNEAIDIYFDALRLAKQIEDEPLIAYLHYQLAVAHRLIKDYEQAFNFLDLADEYENMDAVKKYQIKLERWANSSERKDTIMAETIAIQASEIDELPLNYQMRYWNNLGNMLFTMTKLDSAETVLTMALSRPDTVDVEREVIAEIYRNLGLVFEAKNDTKISLEMFSKALHFYNSKKSNIRYLNVADKLYSAYQSTDAQLAAFYYQRIFEYSKGMTILNDQIRKAHIQYQVQAAVYKHESEQRKISLLKERVAYVSGLAIFLLILIVVILFFKNETNKKRIQVKKMVDEAESFFT